MKWFLIATLYISQAIPLGFFVIAMPTILRNNGASLETIGLFAALAAPWLFKFLWAPFVDRFGRRDGHYRSWILPLQSFSVIAVVTMAWVAPDQQLGALAAISALFMICSATQDVATDGLAVRILSAEERGLGNGVQVGGYYLGQIVGGGLVLVLYDRFGWSGSMFAMAAALAVPLWPAWRFKEPALDPSLAHEPVGFRALGRFFRRSGALGWVLLLLLYRTGDAMALRMLNPLFVDRGLSVTTIGVLLGVALSAGALAGAVLGGILVRRLGRRNSLVFFAVFHAVTLLGYLAPASGYMQRPALYAIVVGVAFSGGLATTALYTCMMDRCQAATAGTDFTVQQSLCAIGPLIGSSFSGAIAAQHGYTSLFVIAVVVSVLSAIAALRFVPASSGTVTGVRSLS